MMKRRSFLISLGTVFIPACRTVKAGMLTPSQAEGPFYPVTPIPERNNLVLDFNQIKGQLLTLKGRVIDQKNQPVSDVTVEIWQCDAQGIYAHPQQSGVDDFDPAFAGFGAMQTDLLGRYQFNTILPVPYFSRPPHIHVKLKKSGEELLTTQLYIQGKTGDEWWAGDEREHLQFSLQNGNIAEFDFIVG